MRSNRISNMKPIACIQPYEKKSYYLNDIEYYSMGNATKHRRHSNVACNTSLRAVESTVNFKDHYKTSNLNKNTLKPTDHNVKIRKTPATTKLATKYVTKVNNKSILCCIGNSDAPKLEQTRKTQLISLMPARHRVTSVIKTKKTLEYNKTKVADVKISKTDELAINNYNKEMRNDELDLEINLKKYENVCDQTEHKSKTEKEIFLDKIIDEILITNIIECIKEFTSDNYSRSFNYSKLATGDFNGFSGNSEKIDNVVFRYCSANENMKYKYEQKSDIVKPICYNKLENPVKIENSFNRFISNNYLATNDPVIKSIQLREKDNAKKSHHDDFESIQIFEGIKEAFKRRFKKKFHVKRNKKNNKKHKRYYKYLNTYLNIKKDLQKKKLKLTLKQISRRKSKENRLAGRVLWKCKK